MMGNLIVTTGTKSAPENIEIAERMARRLDVSYIARGRDSMASMKQKYKTAYILVVRHGDLFLETPSGEFFFHPNMAHVRIKNLRQGKKDRFIEAAGIKMGMTVLDCTLGLGSDAIVASYVTGETGAVRGLEVSPVIAAVVAFGLKRMTTPNNVALAAMRRIQVITADYKDFLRRQPDKSVDVIYFDPMFRRPLLDSVSLNPLRSLADNRPLSEDAVREARRVARCRIVMKEARDSQEFSRLGFSVYEGGRYSRVGYGVVDLSSGK